MAESTPTSADGPEARAKRDVPRNPRPVCDAFQAQPTPAEFWCVTCHWNRLMHDDERSRTAVANALSRLNTVKE